MQYEIDIQGLAELRANWERNPSVVREELEAAVTEADLLLEREVKERMPTAQGTLRSSVFHEQSVGHENVIGLVSTPLSYAAPVELGTKPHFPPVEALIDWVRVKLGISGEAAARGAAFLIARKISVRGTKAQPAFGQAFTAHQDEVHRIFDRASARIAERLAGGAAGV